MANRPSLDDIFSERPALDDIFVDSSAAAPAKTDKKSPQSLLELLGNLSAGAVMSTPMGQAATVEKPIEIFKGQKDYTPIAARVPLSEIPVIGGMFPKYGEKYDLPAAGIQPTEESKKLAEDYKKRQAEHPKETAVGEFGGTLAQMFAGGMIPGSGALKEAAVGAGAMGIPSAMEQMKEGHPEGAATAMALSAAVPAAYEKFIGPLLNKAMNLGAYKGLKAIAEAVQSGGKESGKAKAAVRQMLDIYKSHDEGAISEAAANKAITEIAKTYAEQQLGYKGITPLLTEAAKRAGTGAAQGSLIGAAGSPSIEKIPERATSGAAKGALGGLINKKFGGAGGGLLSILLPYLQGMGQQPSAGSD